MPQRVYDPQGQVEVIARNPAKRVRSLEGLRVAVLDNTKWNAAKLLDSVVELLGRETRFAEVNRYRKETFTKPAAPELIDRIVADNDLAVIAIAD